MKQFPIKEIAQICIIVPDFEEATKNFYEKFGYGIHHLGVLTDDMQKSVADAKEAGIAVTMDGAGYGPDDNGHYAYLNTEPLVQTTFELI